MVLQEKKMFSWRYNKYLNEWPREPVIVTWSLTPILPSIWADEGGSRAFHPLPLRPSTFA